MTLNERKPFVVPRNSSTVYDKDGNRFAMCETTKDALFVRTAANHLEEMMEALRYTRTMVEAIQTKSPGDSTTTRLKFIAEHLQRTCATIEKGAWE